MSVIGQAFLNWEPIPWNSGPISALKQWRGYKKRTGLKIVWEAIDWSVSGELNTFGLSRQKLISEEAVCFATFSNEQCILFQNIWFGWPDPPEYGLASRQIGKQDAWQYWGHFDALPRKWTVPALP